MKKEQCIYCRRKKEWGINLCSYHYTVEKNFGDPMYYLKEGQIRKLERDLIKESKIKWRKSRARIKVQRRMNVLLRAVQDRKRTLDFRIAKKSIPQDHVYVRDQRLWELYKKLDESVIHMYVTMPEKMRLEWNQ